MYFWIFALKVEQEKHVFVWRMFEFKLYCLSFLNRIWKIAKMLKSIYKFGLSVCLFVSNKRQNGWTDRAQIFYGTSRDHREGLWMFKISNICLHQNSIFIKFSKILKIHEIVCENPRIIFVLFYDVHKENMFTIILEDGREAPSKASIIKICQTSVFTILHRDLIAGCNL